MRRVVSKLRDFKMILAAAESSILPVLLQDYKAPFESKTFRVFQNIRFHAYIRSTDGSDSYGIARLVKS